MKKRKKRSTIKFLKILITLYLCVIAMPFTFLTTLAKYTSTVSASGTVGIARPVLNLQTKPVTNTVNPVNSMEVNFSVVNFENGVVNEVKLDYTISFVIDDSVTNSLDIPLKLQLYDGNNQEITLNSYNTAVESISMPASTPTTHEYKLVVSWNGGDKSPNYAGLEKKIKISLDVVQARIM